VDGWPSGHQPYGLAAHDDHGPNNLGFTMNAEARTKNQITAFVEICIEALA
jgi:hypothetical protein